MAELKHEYLSLHYKKNHAPCILRKDRIRSVDENLITYANGRTYEVEEVVDLGGNSSLVNGSSLHRNSNVVQAGHSAAGNDQTSEPEDSAVGGQACKAE